MSTGEPSAFGFRVHASVPLRFLRVGGGAEPLEVGVAAEPRARPETAPLAEWTLPGVDHQVRASVYGVDRGYQLWLTDLGCYVIDPERGRIEMPRADDEILREQRLWAVPTTLCYVGRGDLSLHAAAVEVEGRAVVLAAPGRFGKSTLALAFHRRGYRVLSEDLSCLRPGPEPAVLPGPALLRIRPDMYGGEPPAGTHVVMSRPDRIYLGIRPERKGSSAPVPLRAIMFLRESPGGVGLEPMAPSAAVPDLWHLNFRVATNEARAQSFQRLARLAGVVPIWNLYRPVTVASLEVTVDQIVAALGRQT